MRTGPRSGVSMKLTLPVNVVGGGGCAETKPESTTSAPNERTSHTRGVKRRTAFITSSLLRHLARRLHTRQALFDSDVGVPDVVAFHSNFSPLSVDERLPIRLNTARLRLQHELVRRSHARTVRDRVAA